VLLIKVQADSEVFHLSFCCCYQRRKDSVVLSIHNTWNTWEIYFRVGNYAKDKVNIRNRQQKPAKNQLQEQVLQLGCIPAIPSVLLLPGLMGLCSHGTICPIRWHGEEGLGI
jgi:hypothetical protein